MQTFIVIAILLGMVLGIFVLSRLPKSNENEPSLRVVQQKIRVRRVEVPQDRIDSDDDTPTEKRESEIKQS